MNIWSQKLATAYFLPRYISPRSDGGAEHEVELHGGSEGMVSHWSLHFILLKLFGQF